MGTLSPLALSCKDRVDFEQADKDRRSLTCSQSHSQRQEIPVKKKVAEQNGGQGSD